MNFKKSRGYTKSYRYTAAMLALDEIATKIETGEKVRLNVLFNVKMNFKPELAEQLYASVRAKHAKALVNNTVYSEDPLSDYQILLNVDAFRESVAKHHFINELYKKNDKAGRAQFNKAVRSARRSGKDPRESVGVFVAGFSAAPNEMLFKPFLPREAPWVSDEAIIALSEYQPLMAFLEEHRAEDAAEILAYVEKQKAIDVDARSELSGKDIMMSLRVRNQNNAANKAQVGAKLLAKLQGMNPGVGMHIK